MIFNKRAQQGMSVGKLIALILAVVVIALVIFGFATGAFTPLKEKVVGMYDSVLVFFYGEKQQIANKSIEFTINNKTYECNLELDSSGGKWCKVDLKKCTSRDNRILSYNVYCYDLSSKMMGFFKEDKCYPIKILTLSEINSLIGPYIAKHFGESPGSLLYIKNKEGIFEPANPLDVEVEAAYIINYISEGMDVIKIQDQLNSSITQECR